MSADLLGESGQRADVAALAATQLGPNATVSEKWLELTATLAWPDPYGPDPVVFGSVPRVRA